MSEVLPPLFLSSVGYEEAVRIFETFQVERSEAVTRAVDSAAEHLVTGSWARYDDTYLSLYVLHLAGHGQPRCVLGPTVEEETLPNRETVAFHLSFSLGGNGSRYALLDERAVANLINFRHALERLIPFRMHPHLLGLDIPWKRQGVGTEALPARHMALGFQVGPHLRLQSRESEGDGILMLFDVLYPDLAGVRPLTGGGHPGDMDEGLVSSFLEGAAWKAISARFNVDGVAVHGRT